MAKKSSADSTLMSNLLDAIEMEAHLQLMFHVDHRFLKAVKFAQHKQLAKFGEDGEGFVEMLMRQVFRLGGVVQYSPGTITSQDIASSPSDAVVAIFKANLGLVEEVCEKFEDFCQQAWDAHNEDVRHVYKDLIDWHHEQILWLGAQVRWADDLGSKEYVASGGMVG